MILTVTLNPLLEKRFVLDSVNLGKVNRAASEYFYAGGKGINVSRQLNKLGIQNQALLFAGGNNGKILRRLLGNESIDFSIVNTKEDTRLASILIEKPQNRMTSILGNNTALQKSEVDEFKSRMAKMIPNSSIVIFSGSSPGKLTDDVFPLGIKLANEQDKIVILDTYGEHLAACIEQSPMVIHNNVDEINSSLGINLRSPEDKLEFMKQMNKKGIKLTFLTNGNKSTLASKFEFHYLINNPEVEEADSTGSGDAFTAGIAYGLEKSLVFNEFTSIASALGAANAKSFDACNVSYDEMSSLLNSVEIKPIGKKMKIIDDSPTIA
jgi:1-phosphofructokinase family hexose kinase